VATTSPLLQLPVLQADLARVEDELLTSVRSEDPFLTDVASHLIRAGGKRVRPAFALTAGAIGLPAMVPPIPGGFRGRWPWSWCTWGRCTTTT